MSLPPFINGRSKEEAFWAWFVDHSERLFHFDKNREVIFDELAAALNKVNPDLIFEFGPIQEGKREFVISADGIKSAFKHVEQLYAKHPDMKEWKIIKYRPRKEVLCTINCATLSITPEDVHYRLFRDGDKIGVLLFMKGYTEQERSIYKVVGYLFLDDALGEYDVEMRIGEIQFLGLDSEYFDKAKPLTELREEFDSIR